MARNQCDLQRAEIASGPDANRVRVAVFSCMIFLCMSGWLGCQKSQPYLLGSAPSYLRPYSPGAPIVPPEGASVGPSAPYSGSPYSGSPQAAAPQAAASQAATPSGGTSSIASAFGFPSGPANPASDPTGFGYAAQISELERRAKLLDENNRQLHSQLAQSQQQVQTYRERSDLMQQQLGDMSAQLQQARIAAARPAPSSSPIAGPPALSGVSSLATSSPALASPALASPALPSPPAVPSKSSLQNPSQNPSQRSGARLTANTSRPPGSGGSVSSGGLGGASSIEPLRSLGYPVETNGTSLRVRIPADQLFQPGSSQWTASAGSLLERVSNALRTASPNAQLLIDSYTDNSTTALATAGSAEQLTSQQADSVMRYFVSRGGWNSSGVTIRSNGSEGPLMDNQSPSGRAANRRIEFILTEPL
ncbi:MAG: OmpA family protein [Planctomycetota bacterium]|nr:OmpA family protein [Planctomycetota bacterium]